MPIIPVNIGILEYGGENKSSIHLPYFGVTFGLSE